MASCSESTIDYKGGKVFLRRGGSGQPLLFLHGAGGIPGWLPYFDRLSDRYDVIAPDHPTFGQSDEPAWVEKVDDLAYFYLDFIKEHGLDNVHLVGQSLGGWIALEIAVRSTRNLASLTLVGAAGIRIKGRPAADLFIMDDEELARALFKSDALAEQMLAMEPTEDQQDIIIKNKVATARLAWQPRLFNPALRKWLHRIDVPTHVIWGDSDRIIPPDYAGEFGGLIDGATVTMIEDCGHLPNIEQTGAFIDAVTGFCDRHAA